MTDQATPNAPVDLAAGEKALRRIEPILRALPRDTLLPVNVDAQDVAMAALALVDRARDPARLARFQRLPAESFASDTLEQLELAAWALWYTQARLRSENAAARDVRVDAALFDDAGRQLARMLKLLDYYVGHLPEVATELADIRSGTGYQDRASDLVRAAALVERHAAALAADRLLYAPDLAPGARSFAEAILTSLAASLTRSAAEWSDLRARAYTRVFALYDDVRSAGDFLFRSDPEQRAQFVPLRSLIPRTRGAAPAPTAPEPVESAG